MKKIVVLIMLLLTSFVYAKEEEYEVPEDKVIWQDGKEHNPKEDGKEVDEDLDSPATELIEGSEENRTKRVLEKTYTVMLQAKIDIYVPLEILTDIDIDELLVGDETKVVPFEVVMNKTPEKKDYYKLNFEKTQIDIDGDGRADTFINCPKYINSRVVRDDTYVELHGDKIENDGTYSKRIFVTVEVDQ